MAAKTPTPHGISALLRKAGFERAAGVPSRGGRSGFRVVGDPGQVWVTYAGNPLFTSREFQRDELGRYAPVITAAGFRAEVDERVMRLVVTAPTAGPAGTEGGQ